MNSTEMTEMGQTTRRRTVEYKVFRRNITNNISKKRYFSVGFLSIAQVSFILLIAVFANYDLSHFGERQVKVDSSSKVIKDVSYGNRQVKMGSSSNIITDVSKISVTISKEKADQRISYSSKILFIYSKDFRKVVSFH